MSDRHGQENTTGTGQLLDLLASQQHQRANSITVDRGYAIKTCPAQLIFGSVSLVET